MKKERVLIIGGLHGDEPTGIAVARYFQLHPHDGIVGFVGNEEASSQNIRFIETDLNRSFQPKVVVSIEEQIAQKLKRKTQDFDVIIDIHNTRGDDTTCTITTMVPNAVHFSLAKYFGFEKLVIMPDSGSLIAEKQEKAISLEIALNDREKFSVQYLIEKIKRLDLAVGEERKIVLYEFIRSIPTTTLQRVNIQPSDIHNFKELTYKQKQALGLSIYKIYCPIFAKKRFSTETGFDLVERI